MHGIRCQRKSEGDGGRDGGGGGGGVMRKSYQLFTQALSTDLCMHPFAMEMVTIFWYTASFVPKWLLPSCMQ